jgi:alcohol dehydrogenase
MKVAQFISYGGPEVIEIKDVSKPILKEKQVLVEVYGASINPFDDKLRLGNMKEIIPLQLPITIGGDFSGIVTEIGQGVSEFKVGDQVYGQALILSGGSGSLAEFATSNTKDTALKPKNVDFVEAASLVLVGVSAVQALTEHITLKKDQKILIQGGAGGIGSIALQLAKHLRAYVVTTVSKEDMEFVKKLGADEVIDYHTQDFEEILKDFDAVFDTVGGETTNKSIKVLKKGGILVSMAGQSDQELAKQNEVTALTQKTQTNTERLDHLAELVDQGIIKPQIDKVFPLVKSKEAFEYFENNHPNGKVVIKVKG